MESLLSIADNLESLYETPKKDENAKFPFWSNYFKV